ncbi:hypothetical protein RhiXN_03952 [Rhizoctonia solani]|uniref:Protein PET100, mitochondrial n=1 Tax=Rhizoctonia solani TaxID=456999 RepID=A0A8H8NP67_9AGAM|nr:uncharacterized protein RhiXN_03952 [Rhizoctonia solani]QRW15951.1 hypothetical protein RhiXN_03952 [Rhizoctonia solani]
MAGGNLEVFKFGVYLFIPIFTMFYYASPEWYNKHVLPARDRFWPPEDKTNKPPTNPTDLHAELARLRAERLARRAKHSPDSESSSDR